MSDLPTALDRILEFPVVTSFTNLGFHARKRLFDWRPLDSYDLGGRTIAITGPTSGLGKVAAEQFARLGARLILVARNPEKTEAVRDELASATGNADISIAIADLGSLGQVRGAADTIMKQTDRLDVLIHNAGALFNDRRTAEDGIELTVKVQVISPFLLTSLLLDTLEAAAGRVLTMASGGMYAAGLTIDRLQMEEEEYKGAEQYARAKRAQVTLNEMWAERGGHRGIRFHALHPGWADTPGVEAALPGFRKVMGPLLRNPLEGADTLVWLAADDGPPLHTNGLFWHDRRPRPIHKLPTTRRTDTPERRAALWNWVSDQAGIDPTA